MASPFCLTIESAQEYPTPSDSNSNTEITPQHGPSNSENFELLIDTNLMSRKRTIEEFSTNDNEPLEPNDTSSTDYVCGDCSSMNLERILSLTPGDLQSTPKGILIAELGTRLQRVTAGACRLCDLLARSVPPTMLQTSRNLELRAYSFLKSSYGIQWYFVPRPLRSEDQPMLAVVSADTDAIYLNYVQEEMGQLHCSTHDTRKTTLFIPEVISQQANISFIQQCLVYCKRHHQSLCGSMRSSRTGLRVIDCHKLQIVQAPIDCAYVALSYVWSESNRILEAGQESEGLKHIVIESASRTIQDAISLVKQLGIRYLWIDRYCIDQNDSSRKHNQIRHMDAVYTNAEFTIIAAAGRDEDHGLPGVDGTSRSPQSSCTVRGMCIVNTMHHPHWAISESIWSTRGWTYQEAVLSRRRLVFTDEQVYFECNAMNCCETLHYDLDKLHCKRKNKSLRMLHNGVLAGKENFAFGSIDAERRSLHDAMKRYTELIENYSNRRLTYEQDALNAFLGIARHMQISRFPLQHICGMPFPVPRSELDKPLKSSRGPPQLSQGDLCIDFSYSLTGAHEKRDYIDLWGHPRRDWFPSWSWVGWKGAVKFLPFHNPSWLTYYRSEIRSISFEVESGVCVDSDTCVLSKMRDNNKTGWPQALRFDAMRLGLASVRSLERSRGSTWTLCGLKTEIYPTYWGGVAGANLECIIDCLKSGKWWLILLGRMTIRDDRKDYFMIIRPDDQGNSWSRTGLLEAFATEGLHISDDLQAVKIRLV